MMSAPKLISLNEAAARMGVSRRTVDRYIEQGRFVPLFKLPGGHLRCDKYTLDNFIRGFCNRGDCDLIEPATSLAFAVSVYEQYIESDEHNQGNDFHRSVANDARHVLAALGVCEKPKTPPSSAAKGSARAALREVCSELHTLCMSVRGPKKPSSLAARKKAAALLGMPLSKFTKFVRYG